MRYLPIMLRRRRAAPVIDPGPSGDPAVITDALLDASFTCTVDQEGDLFYIWEANITDIGGAAIEAGALAATPDQTFAVIVGENTGDLTGEPVIEGTNYLKVVHKNAEGSYSNRAILEYIVEAAPAGTTFTEDYSAYTVGNTFTQLDAAYARSGANMVPTIVTDADDADGKAISIDTGSNHEWLRRDDVQTAIAGGWTRIQFRARIKIRTTGNGRGALGCYESGEVQTGISVYRYGAGANQVNLQRSGDANGAGNTTGLLFNVAEDTEIDVLFEIGVTDKSIIRGKAWLASGSEPAYGAGGTATMDHTSDVPFTNFSLMGRLNNPALHVQKWTIGIDADAPAL